MTVGRESMTCRFTSNGNMDCTVVHSVDTWYCSPDGTQPPPVGGSPGGGGQPSSPGPQEIVNAEDFVECFSQIIEYDGTREFGDQGTGQPIHEGIDLFAPSGTPIYSPVSGRVVTIIDGVPRDSNIETTGVETGNQIAIEPDGAIIETGTMGLMVDGAVWSALLGHMDPGFSNPSGLNIQENMCVEKGQLIGFSDNTGYTNIGPHLDITIHQRQTDHIAPQAIDPRLLFVCP